MKKTIILISILCFGLYNAFAQDWPDWRGVNREGTWNEPDVVKEFKAKRIPLKWSVPIGSGYTGPTVSNGRVFLMDRQEEPNQVERVHCFDSDTGERIWSYSYNCEYVGIGYPAGPRSSVIIDGSSVYSLGAMGHLFCFNVANGKIQWERDLNAELMVRMPIWGIAAAPLIVNEKLIIQIGGSDGACVVALDKKTGEEIWRSLSDKASYSAPILIQQAGEQVVVVWTSENLAGLDPVTGNVYWKIPFELSYEMGVATPVFYKDHIFVSGFFNGSLLVKLSQLEVTAEKVWQRSGESERKTDALHCTINTPVILEDYIYGVDSYGELRCLEFENGNRVWEDLSAVNKNRWANIHFIRNGEKIWMFNEHGELIISRLTPKGFHEISRAKLIEPTTNQLNRKGIGVTWAHPAFVNKHVYIRSDKELICADLSK